MSYILRIINKNRWYRDAENYPGKEQADAPADTLVDLRTEENELSVWLVDDDLANLERLLAALAANRQRLDKLDYTLFSEEIFEQIGIQVQQTVGDVPDAVVNQWHLALVNLTAMQVAELARSIWHSPVTQTFRCLPKQVAKLIAQAIHQEYFRLEQLQSDLHAEVVKYMARP
ncbi:MAG: hypothetical protein U0350_51175 [Caldilineaceae bacterium]